MEVYVPSEQIWMVVVGFLIAFVLSFGIGANDVANSFGTSVGSKVLTLRQACVLASIFETLGAILLGAKVSDTIRKGIIDVEPYINSTNGNELLMAGNVAALSGSCVWLMMATLLRMPVSATHSIVGATVGFALVAHGAKGIHWGKLGTIIGSWFVSPVLAGCVSTAIFYFCKFFILSKEDPLEPGLRWLPFFYASTVIINMFSVFYNGPEMLYFDRIPLYGTFIIAIGSGLICAITVRCFVVPWMRRRITETCSKIFDEEMAASKAAEMKPAAAVIPIEKAEEEHQLVSEAISEMDNNVKAAPTDNGTGPAPAGAANTSLPRPRRERKISGSFLDPPQAPLQGTGRMGAPGNVINEIVKHNVPVKNNVKTGLKINKDEDAPLVNNEYRLGKSTPTKNRHNTVVDDVNRNNKTGAGLHAPNSPPQTGSASGSFLTGSDSELDGRETVVDRPQTARLFSVLQVLTAVFGGFAHGGNDVSNAIGPLVSLWLIGTTQMVAEKASTPIWILFYGGAGISIGLWVWGRRVIKTLGEDLTKITPSSGFCIEIGSALTVLVASNVGIPISTTHCKVGSVVCVGRFRARENVDWSIFRNIVLAWMVTLPICGGISAAFMALFKYVIFSGV